MLLGIRVVQNPPLESPNPGESKQLKRYSKGKTCFQQRFRHFANSKRLELKRVSCRIEEEHRRLFVDLSKRSLGSITNATPATRSRSQRDSSLLHGQHDAEVRPWNIVPVDWTMMHRLCSRRRPQVNNHLVPEEIEKLRPSGEPRMPP